MKERLVGVEGTHAIHRLDVDAEKNSRMKVKGWCHQKSQAAEEETNDHGTMRLPIGASRFVPQAS
jgi:hypothetical protein